MAGGSSGKSRDKADNGDNEAKPAKGGPGLIIIAVVALLAASAGAAAAYLIAPANEVSSASSSDGHEPKAGAGQKPALEKKDAHDESKGKDKKKKKDAHGGGHGKQDVALAEKIQVFDNAAFFTLDPLIVSITPIGRARHLKVAIVVETPPETVGAIPERLHHIRDVANTYLRTVDAADFENPAAMARLRAQLLRRIRTVAPNADVRNILITEFILT